MIEESLKKGADVQMGSKADLLVLGNVITMDEHKPRAEAVVAKGDKIIYVGAADVAKKLCDENAKVIDYGSNSVYPGFLEAHCHPGGAGAIALVAQMTRDNTPEECAQIMKQYADAHPERKVIQGMGFEEKDEPFHASLLDAVCPDKPMVVTDFSGHSMWINTKAMQEFGIDQDAVEAWGTNCVRVDEDGKPTGFISENPVFHVRSCIKSTLDEIKLALQTWHGFALSMGYTGAYNAGVNLISECEPDAYHKLEEEGQLKFYTFAGHMVQDNTDTPEEDIAAIAKDAAENNSKHYELIGAKVFCDGTVELHTAWVIDEYLDQPGYHGVSRFDDHDKIVRLVKAASEHGLNVHIHTIGDAATRAWVDGIAEAEEATGNFDMRNALAHLQMVRPEEIYRFGKYNIVAVAAMMWCEKTFTDYTQMMKFTGEELTKVAYPSKSFKDGGAVLVSHSDFPVSPAFSVPQTICYGVQRYLPSNGQEMQRENTSECLSRMDTLKAITTNVA